VTERILIDLNVLLNVLQKREPFYQASSQLLAAVETGKVEGYVSAHSITTLFYLVQMDKGKSEARALITNLMQFIKIALVDQATIEQALNLDYPDFEDAVQMMAAVQGKMGCLVSRNFKDYQPALLSVVQPIDYIAAL
jgi:predicted nucleic acid-binding protein